ncbi:hypothetical protein BJF93_18660 [Xaviernesmea oryzae]|uniref:Uncharacterized protein n=1 Tax=Xaviernesmea oryzae TaxID=464029 RepID=A0A1Q9B2P4_9HYPH|nr:hypothetical protein [Xaviernesmea oryzae]OLP62243.1 hypothetical protein BJF93_18660 [Xaviernesmea oryzae]SEL93005.1 hypothetical protein SAMN04487976_11565 [Xaviernesmea oryzae]
MTKIDILGRYLVAAGLACLVGLVSIWLGDPPSLVFHKMLFTPVFLLASHGLRSLFPEANDGKRGLIATIELQLLTAGLLAAFVLFIGPFERTDASKLFELFALFTLVLASVNLVLGHIKRDDKP